MCSSSMGPGDFSPWKPRGSGKRDDVEWGAVENDRGVFQNNYFVFQNDRFSVFKETMLSEVLSKMTVVCSKITILCSKMTDFLCSKMTDFSVFQNDRFSVFQNDRSTSGKRPWRCGIKKQRWWVFNPSEWKLILMNMIDIFRLSSLAQQTPNTFVILCF